MAASSAPDRRTDEQHDQVVLMGDFKNDFAWSPSRGGMFATCPRLYWLRYYGSWGGWNRSAHPGRRIAYRLGKMTGIPRWRGSIVHETLEWASGRISKKLPVTLEQVRARAIAAMRAGWLQSREGGWVHDPKRNVNLWEHYYLGDTEEVHEQARAARAVIESALAKWWDLGWPELLERLGQDDWVELEGLQTVMFRNVKVFVQPDLAYWRDGVLMVVDWKTGRPKPADESQVLIYVIWAIKEHQVPLDRIRTQLVYLQEGGEKTSRVSEAQLRAFADDLYADIERVRGQLAHVGRNEARARDFPKTTDTNLCARCDFNQLCHGGGRYPGPARAGDPVLLEEPEAWPGA